MLLTNTSTRLFVGRDEVLGTLNKRVESLKSGYRQNVALTGQKLCGKTTILQRFLATLRDEKVIPVYIEVLTEPFESFAKKFIGTILVNFLKGSCDDAREDLDFLLAKTREMIPRTTHAIREVLRLLDKGNNQEAYSALFDLTTVIKDETGRSCVIILDEFHNLSFFNLKNPFAVFGKKIMVQKDTMYVVSSSQVSSIKRILKERLDLLFGNFEIIEIKDFDYSISRHFLDTRLKGVSIQDELKDFLILFTDGRPFYIDIIAAKMLDLSARHPERAVDAALISEALEDLLFDSRGTVNQYFQNLTALFTERPQLTNEYLEILTSLAEHKRRLTQIRSRFTGKKTDLPTRLEKLLEENIIAKNGVIYYFNDRVFEFWLKCVYNRKRYSMTNIFQDRSDMFRREVEGLIARFIEERRVSIDDRIASLMNAFNNEVIILEEKGVKLPKFASVKIEERLETNGSFMARGSYGTGKTWIFQCCRQQIDEVTMTGLIERSKKVSDTAQKRVVIALGTVDPNALLIAKENRVWVWKKEDLNFLFSLYSKTKITC
ncbi:MAG: ATP-binding protein [Candidatus Omnitrophota bacterium]